MDLEFAGGPRAARPVPPLPQADHGQASPCKRRPRLAPRRFQLRPVHNLADGNVVGVVVGLAGAPEMPDPKRLLGLACAEIHQWQAIPLGLSALFLPLRLRSPLVCGLGLAEMAAAALTQTGAAAACLTIGLGEAMLGSAGWPALLALSALRDRGVGVALDEVSVLPSSLHRLPRLPLTSLRLHPCVARDLARDRASRRALRELVHAAHDQGATVMAADVRTALQRDILSDLRCDSAEGPLFGPPMQARAFRAALAG